MGYVIVLSSVFLYALCAVYYKKAGLILGPWSIILIASLVSGIISMMMCIFNGEAKGVNMGNLKLIGVVVITSIVNTIAFYLGVKAYSYMPLWEQAMFSLLQPVFIALIAFYVLGEQVSYKIFIGLVFISVGLFIAVRP